MNGKIICGYRILGILGKGGQGTVYLAEHEVLHRKYALKYAYGAEREQLKQEAAVMKELTDRRIPFLVDQIEEDNVSVLVMEYVEGVSLKEYLQNNVPLEEDEALELLYQITEIVAYLHQQKGIVAHRDLKPANFVMAKDGSLHLLDFGTALTGMESLHCRDLCGTPGYAAPEQMCGARSGTEADVYALGAVYAYLLTGIDPALPPFHPPAPEECTEKVSKESRRLLRKTLDPAPEMRLQDATCLLREIETVQKRKKHLPARMESIAYQTVLIADVILATVLVGLRYRERPLEYAKWVCGGITILLFFWYLLRSLFGPRERFVITREWNVTYTAKERWGL